MRIPVKIMGVEHGDLGDMQLWQQALGRVCYNCGAADSHRRRVVVTADELSVVRGGGKHIQRLAVRKTTPQFLWRGAPWEPHATRWRVGS